MKKITPASCLRNLKNQNQLIEDISLKLSNLTWKTPWLYLKLTKVTTRLGHTYIYICIHPLLLFHHRSTLLSTEWTAHNTKYKRSRNINPMQYSIIWFNQAHHCSLIWANYEGDLFLLSIYVIPCRCNFGIDFFVKTFVCYWHVRDEFVPKS